MADMLIHFANALDPNGHSNITNATNANATSPLTWPKYTLEKPTMLEFVGDSNTSLTLAEDTYREEGISFLMELNLDNTWPY